MKNIRYIVLKNLLNLDDNKSYSNIVLNNAIKKENLEKRDASFCTAIFYGVLEKKLFLDYIIEKYSKTPLKKISKPTRYILYIGLYQILFMDKVPNNAAVNESVNLCKKIKEFSSSGFVNGILRFFLRNNCETYIKDLKNDYVSYLSIKYSLYKWIVELFLENYKNLDIEELLKSFEGRPPINIRLNNLKGDRSFLIDNLLKEGLSVKEDESLRNCLEINGTNSIESLKSYKDGLFHVQDKASQICSELLEARHHDIIVDVCSAPGGKSFTISETMNNEGTVYSYDLYESKVNLIKNGAKRLGINIIEANVRNAKDDPVMSSFADRVICDVPCSGLGVIRRKPEIRYKDKKSIENLPKIQYDILCKSEKMLKSGGILIYSTCTLNPKENNEIADRFLKEHNNYEPVDVNFKNIKSIHNEASNQLTLFPNIHSTDGFFIAKFKKTR